MRGRGRGSRIPHVLGDRVHRKVAFSLEDVVGELGNPGRWVACADREG